MEVYLDLVMLLNFAVQLLLLLGAYRLSAHPPDYKRALCAAVMGSIYAVVCLLPGFSGFAKFPWHILCLCLMSVLCYGWGALAIRQGAIFLFLSFALNGFVLLMGQGGHVSVMLSAALLAVLCVVGFGGGSSKREYATVSICHGKKHVRMTALVDTGNMLKDPVTGNSVMVVDRMTADKLLGLTTEQLEDPIGTISRGKYPGLRLIPYTAVGKSAGMLLAMKMDELRINGQISTQIVAFAPQSIGQGSGYEALLGGIV